MHGSIDAVKQVLTGGLEEIWKAIPESLLESFHTYRYVPSCRSCHGSRGVVYLVLKVVYVDIFLLLLLTLLLTSCFPIVHNALTA